MYALKIDGATIATSAAPIAYDAERLSWLVGNVLYADANRAFTVEASTPPRRYKVSPPEYLLLFTPDERIAIRALAVSTATEDAPFAPYVADLLSIIDNPRLTFVDLALDQTKRGHDLLIMAGRLTPERQAEIECGLPE